METNKLPLSKIAIRNFGSTTDGTPVYLFTLKNKNDIAISISNYGGTITSIHAPDRNGSSENIALGFEDFESYLGSHPFFGATIGRYANRISNSSFRINGKKYQLAPNEGPNHLHGGITGFDKVVWDFETPDEQTLVLSYSSEDGDEGYPGTLHVTVTFTLTDRNELKIDYHAETDRKTPVNLTNHTYFNLTGNPANTILEHELEIVADAYTPVDDASIPTGDIADVAGTPFDFTTAKPIGRDIKPLKNGYDHNYVISRRKGNSPRLIAVAYDPLTGRKLETFTDKPGVQLYTGGGLSADIGGSKGPDFCKFGGFCLETQFFPDSPNIDHFPSPMLEPDDVYKSTTIYRFSTE